jgi:hypothetical protein
MRWIAIAMVLALMALGAAGPVRAQATNSCKTCAESQRACVKNHSRAACTTEYDICMKHCRAK